MKILIIGGTGLIGGYLFKNLKNHEIHTIGRSKLDNNIFHHQINLSEEKNFYLKINHKFDVIINCISYQFLQHSNLNIYFSNILKLLKNDKSLIIEISTLSTFLNLSDKRNLYSKYGKKKIECENIIIKLKKKFKHNLIIYRIGAVCLKKSVHNFIYDKFKKLILGNYFLNLFNKDNTFIKITFLEDLLVSINNHLSNKVEFSKIIILFNNINPLISLYMIRPNLKPIKLNLIVIMFLIGLIKKDLSIKFSLIFDFKLNKEETVGQNQYEFNV